MHHPDVLESGPRDMRTEVNVLQTEARSAGNTELVLHFLGEMDGHRFEAVDAMLAPGMQLHFSGLHFDRDGAMGVVRSLYESFGDLRHDVTETIAAGDRVAVRATLRGSHTGPFEGLAPTGRRIEVGQIAIFRVAEGKIAEIHEEVDGMVVMRQLGALPSAG